MNLSKALVKTGTSVKELSAAMAKIIKRLSNDNKSPTKPVQKPKVNRQDAFKQVAKQGGRSRGFTK